MAMVKQTVLRHECDNDSDEKTQNAKSQQFATDNEAKVDTVSLSAAGLNVLSDDHNNETSSTTPNSLESAADEHTQPVLKNSSDTQAQTQTEIQTQSHEIATNEFGKCEEGVERIENQIISVETTVLTETPHGNPLELPKPNSHAHDDFPSTLTQTATNTNEHVPGVQTNECAAVETQVDRSIDFNATRSPVENERLNSADGHTSGTQTAKYTSLVMITQDIRPTLATSNVNIVPTDTTHIVSVSDSDSSDSITVQHTNRLSDDEYEPNSLAGYFTRSLEEDSSSTSTPNAKRRPIVTNHHSGEFYYSEHLPSFENEYTSSVFDSEMLKQRNYSAGQMANKISANNSRSDESAKSNDDVKVVTGTDTLSAVVRLEDGLADDDSWIGSADEDEEFATTTATDSETEYAEELAMCQSIDREEELRGYNRASIDFTLHTIVEESCEESEVEVNDKKKNRMSASELEKYFFFGLGDGKPSTLSNADNRDDSISETSSLCSEGMDSLGASDNASGTDGSAMASSRLEKYFLSTFMGFSSNERDRNSDGSGSVGSDSEGHASPEQRRKRLVRARGTPHRSHNSSLDNLLATKDDNHDSIASNENPSLVNESNNSSDTDTCDETVIHLEKDANPNDTLKRKKQIKKKSSDTEADKKPIGVVSDEENASAKSSLSHDGIAAQSSANTIPNKKQSSRDSGFIGSNDDLLKSDEPHKIGSELKIELEEIKEETKENVSQPLNAKQIASSSSTSLTRKDSFNNYSSDEETNLMMSKLRQFVKTLVASNANAQRNASKSSTPMMSGSNTPKSGTPVPKPRSKAKPPQLVYFENELTRLMKTVPGINDDQVREIVEYLSSEETWSDSYDSSDYTSSDLEGAASSTSKSELQEQISASCQQIIKKFEGSVGDREGDIGDGGLFEENQCLNRETALVYHKLVSSFSKIGTNEKEPKESNHSPPIFAKVMSHIGTRLVALMHEVSSSESHTGHSPKPSARYHKKLQQKISATTTDEDEDPNPNDHFMEGSESYLNLPRSKSHDLLLSGNRPQHHQSSSGVSDIAAEEKEASDYERFSWRGSFESALLANGDSRTKLTLLDRDNSSSASALEKNKRRSAGDLLFNQCSLSREQLDRVRSCGSIGGAGSGSTDAVNNMESSKLWGSENNQRTSGHRPHFPDSDDESSDEERRHHIMGNRSTLPRSLQTTTSSSTNSLPRSTTNAQSQKSQSVHQFLPSNVKSARYRPPGFSRLTSTPKKANSSLGLPSLYTKRDNSSRTRRIQSLYSGKQFHYKNIQLCKRERQKSKITCINKLCSHFYNTLVVPLSIYPK